MPRARSETQAETRRRILDAAQQEFASRRTSDVSVADIAALAGYTKGAVYSNFSSKTDLLLSVLERRLQVQGAEYIDFIDDSSIVDLAGDVGDRATRTEETDLGYFRVVAAVWAEAVHDPELAERFAVIRRAHRVRLSDAIRRRAEDAGVELHVDPDDLAAGLLAMSMATMLEALIDPGLDVGAIHAAVVDHVVAGVIARGLG